MEMMCANSNLGLRQRDIFLGVAVGAGNANVQKWNPIGGDGISPPAIPSKNMGYPVGDPIAKDDQDL
jgi:hypothetical protein